MKIKKPKMPFILLLLGLLTVGILELAGVFQTGATIDVAYTPSSDFKIVQTFKIHDQ